MPKLSHWVRDKAGKRALKDVPEYVDFESLQERIDAITVVIPYFQQAAQVVLFAKENTNTYPKSMKSLRGQDDELIKNGSYTGLTEGAKAKLLVETAKRDLGI